jgi:serine/threonine protein kinase/tetratricopeptide (TPR) repeat protein
MNETDRTESVFAAAAALAADQRAAYLDRACANDPELRRRVEALLHAHDRREHFLDRPAARQGTVDHTPDGVAGTAIAGRYKLLEAIGEGGMGTVWMAEQREPVKRLVALKLIKPGMDSGAVLARFEAERQALALMDHPHIAKVLDGGTTDNGHPYFVMELVKGLPLTEYCDDRRLSVQDRLNLFVQICSAVQHAHQKGIIHRDLKPSNILVTEHDGKPVPKVIDFGLAKALGAMALTDKTLHTTYGTVVGTPLYMAPEQVGINALDVDTRTDIYALGAILYELLTGSTPLEKRRYKDVAWEEIKRLIREEEPAKPSLRLSSSDALPTLAARRQTEPAKLSRLVRGDLDWIVLKALEKDRNRRYETANGLAMDVQRHLSGEPVLAAPPSATYRLRKFLRKRRGPVLAAVLVLMALLAGIAGTSWGLVEAMSQRDEADAARGEEVIQRQRAETNATKAANSAAEETRQRHSAEANAKKATDAADEERKAKLREAEQRQAAVAAQHRALEALRATTDDVIEQLLGSRPVLGPTEKAFLEATLKRWQVFADEKGDSSAARAIRAEGWSRVGMLRYKLGELEAAAADYREAIRLQKKLILEFPDLPAGRQELAVSHNNLGMLLKDLGKHAEALEQHRQALDLRNALVVEFPGVARHRQDLAQSHNNLGVLFLDLNQRAEAQEHFGQALDLHKQLADEFPAVPAYRRELAASHNNQGIILEAFGKRLAAVEQYRQALDLQKQLVAEFPAMPTYRRELAGTHNNLAIVLQALGKGVEAEEQFRQALDLQAKLAAEFPAVSTYRRDLAATHNSLAVLFNVLRKYTAGEEQFRLALDLQKKLVAEYRNLPAYRQELAHSHSNLATLYLNSRRFAEAEKQFRQALDLHEKLVAERPAILEYQRDLGHTLVNIGILVRDRGKLADSLELFTRAIATLTTVVKKDQGLAAARQSLWLACASRAIALDQLGRHADAAKDWDQAIVLVPAATQRFFKIHRALSQVKAGQVAEAVADVATLTKSTNWSPGDWYVMACVYAVASAKDKDKQEEYASRAVELLQRAVKGGYNDVEKLKNDPDLDPVRGRENFQKLLQSVAPAKQKI